MDWRQSSLFGGCRQHGSREMANLKAASDREDTPEGGNLLQRFFSAREYPNIQALGSENHVFPQITKIF